MNSTGKNLTDERKEILEQIKIEHWKLFQKMSTKNERGILNPLIVFKLFS
jgi:hypothetical protein